MLGFGWDRMIVLLNEGAFICPNLSLGRIEFVDVGCVSFECPVDGEFHMVFECTAFDDVRKEFDFAHLFEGFKLTPSLREFCAADDPAVGKFISRCMNEVTACMNASAEQPTD